MQNIMSKINEYAESNVELYSTIYQNVFPAQANDELMSRADPSTAAEVRYMDGSRVGTVNVSYYAKARDQRKARTELEKIIGILDVQTEISIDDGLLILVEAVTLPSFVSIDETGNYIFTMTIRISYNGGIN